MIKKIFLIYLFSTYLFATKVTIYSECNYPPYSYCEDNNSVKGISIDIYKAIFSKLKEYSLEVKGIDLEEGRKKMKNSEILILGTMSYRPKSRPFVVDYTEPFIYQEKSLFCNLDMPKDLIWPKDFFGLKIAKIKGHSLDTEFKKAIDNGQIKLIEGNLKSNIMNLIEKRVDCYIISKISMKGELLKITKEYEDNNKSLDNIKDIHKVKLISKRPYYIGFSNFYFPQREDLIKKINLAIKVMYNSNEIDDIIDKNLKNYLNPYKVKTINIAIFNWGKFISKNIEENGVLTNIISMAFKNRGIKVKYQFHSPRYSYLLTKWGKTCASIPWFKTEDREQYMYFSNKIKPSSTSLLYMKYKFKKDFEYTKLDDLRDYKIGGLAGYSYESIFYKEKLDYTSYRELTDAIRALILGDIDIVVHNKYIVMDVIEKNFPKEINRVKAHPNNFLEENNYVIFSKKCSNSLEMLKEFNIGFKNIKNDGTIKKILEKYDMSEEIFYDYKFKSK